MERLSVSDIELILNTAESLKEVSERDIKKVPTLRGKSVVNFFYEPSTRTRTSFEMAAKMLSADTISLSASGSSSVKGETLIDTARNLQAMKPDIIVLRHPLSGAPHLLAREVKAGIINAGDGINEHPTQALLDLFTIREKKGKIKGLNVAIIGDISHSRVARSDIIGLIKMGAKVTVSGPPTMIPVGIEAFGVQVVHNPVEAVKKKDVVILLRMQLERQSRGLFPSVREYATFFGVNEEIIRGAKSDVVVMHPGPMNRGVG
ncbi:MAG: aspartate carbamoyltransferase catalytic subunit, partial [Deltaproteobacteria bacterium]|nr:aspartate carbamoyltransferase catalytic subunit [Deltaproteobacteria bacterium]